MASIKQCVAVVRGGTVLLAALALQAGGCSTFFKAEPPVERPTPPLPTPQVKTGGACLELLDSQKPALGRDEFVDKIGTLVANHQQAVAAEWVRRYPDVAWDVLRNANNADAANLTVRFIAKIHDQQCCGKDAAVTWLSMLEDRRARPDVYKTFDTARSKLLEVAGNAKTAETLNMASGLKAPHKLLDIEVCRIAGDALLQNGRVEEATRMLSKGHEQAKTIYPYGAVQLSLSLGEAQRKAGQKDEGAALWGHSLTAAQTLLDTTPPVADPNLWARMAALRPAHVDWSVLGKATEPAKDNALAETALWKKIGQWRLERTEFQSALFAFKRAEALAQSQSQRDELQLLQAKALLSMHQDVAAVTLLARLAELPDPQVVAPTLGLLGSIKLKQGDKTHGLALLQRSVEWRGNTEWPGRAEAQADLGLAYLMNGDEVNGLRCLHEAQSSLEKAGASDMLTQCLANEAHYFERTDKKDQAARIQEKITRLQDAANP